MSSKKIGRISESVLIAVCLVCLVFPVLASAESVPPPREYFGFDPGADRMLFDYEQLVGYLKMVDSRSPRLKLIEIGNSPLGKTMFIACISSGKNIVDLRRLKEINKKLALDSNLSIQERESLIQEGRVFVLSTLSMHSGEVAPSQAAPLIAYKLVTSSDPEIQKYLDNVVLLMVPSHNPDGMDMVVRHYLKYRGTKYEGCDMPGVYHKYVGHDNNRDFVTLTQDDNRAIARIYNQEWFPQVMVEKHQMGSTTARYFVPPTHDPIAENIDARLWNWCGIFGANMIKDMTQCGLKGVSQHYLFDNYWPGSTETSLWKNVISFLTEAASVRYASPIFIEENELEAYGKGLSEYKKSTNMPDPWPGGWWRLGDIVKYEEVSTLSILKTAANHCKDILRLRNDLCRNEVHKGKNQPPFYYLLPQNQHDRSELKKLVTLLQEHGVKVYRLSSRVDASGRFFEKGDLVIPLAQPFRAFIKEVMELQDYPVRHYTPGGEIIRPYDITSWSLPYHRGLECFELNRSIPELDAKLLELDGSPEKSESETAPGDFWALLFNCNQNESYRVAFQLMKSGTPVYRLTDSVLIDQEAIPMGSFVIFNHHSLDSILNGVLRGTMASPLYLKARRELPIRLLSLPRIALVETYFHDMDAGWTRYLFDSYRIPYTVIRPGDFKKIDFSGGFDVIVFPSSTKSILMNGKWKYEGNYYISEYPPEFSKGMENAGLNRLLNFIEKGGIVISWGQSSRLFSGFQKMETGKDRVEEFQLPFEEVSAQLAKKGFGCPGSLMRVRLLKNHPITLGMNEGIGVFFRRGCVFDTTIPSFDMDRRVIGKFVEKDILISGYCEKEDLVANKSVLLWIKKNKGQLVLFGFAPQFRASIHATYKLLFNSLLLERIK